ncbi:MAG: enoyl-CoA hydratase/isomerase family protein [Deltaproteobacteria bacterium]|nr:enoyl-CoA hydratase/isomerase family protein [Deltaproteobacteria bacterium]
MSVVTIERDGGLAVLTMTYEPQNRFTTEFVEGLRDGFRELAEEDAVKAVVWTGGDSKYFSTGFHLDWLRERMADNPDALSDLLYGLNAMMIETAAFPKPLVAALNGHTMAGGCVMAGAADFRVMGETKGFIGVPAVKLGLTYWPGMIAQFYSFLPSRVVKEMTLTGRRYTSTQAQAMGYVDVLCPDEELMDASKALARELAEGNPTAYAEIKLELRREALRAMREDDVAAIEAFLAKLKSLAG